MVRKRGGAPCVQTTGVQRKGERTMRWCAWAEKGGGAQGDKREVQFQRGNVRKWGAEQPQGAACRPEKGIAALQSRGAAGPWVRPKGPRPARQTVHFVAARPSPATGTVGSLTGISCVCRRCDAPKMQVACVARPA